MRHLLVVTGAPELAKQECFGGQACHGPSAVRAAAAGTAPVPQARAVPGLSRPASRRRA
ncbi:hypothetical protein ACFWM0_23395 [Streptomyces sp. NPDC058405]|uniref:hypothetical protein n=1 Tax=unclassified Streptomyces TaxID=2593676 RepID=UPI003650BE28